tara:strand:- start:2817 stop:4403 length:1587 start_codon:yes stop_codon:yes gene_type:complete
MIKLKGKLKQTVRRKQWQDRFFNKVNEIYEKYQKEFESAVLEGKLKKQDVFDILKIMVAPMRFGKTRLAITHHIPFILQNTDVNCIVFTSPLGSILKQKERLLKNTINQLPGVEFCEDPIDAQEALNDGQKVVLVMTNMAAWVGTKAKEFFNNLDKSKVAFIIDEAHTWTTDSPDNVPNVIGGGTQDSKNPSFKAALYERVRVFSPHTPFIFGLTATTNNQHTGKVPALGNMQFKVVNSDFIKDGVVVDELAYRLGWFDPSRVRYMDFGVYENVEEYFNEMISVLMKRESIIGQKLTCFIEAKRSEKHADENSSLKEIKSLIKKSDFKADGVNENSPIAVIMTSDEIQLYNKNGEPIEKVTEKTVYHLLNDQNHPLRFLIVVDMAKMGVDLRTTKLLFSFRQTEKRAKDFVEFGYIIEAALQKYGRLLTPNSGVDEKIFFEQFYGDSRNVLNFHPEMNMMDFWVMDNGMNRQGFEAFGERFAPEMPDMESHLEDCDCPTCGTPRHLWPDRNLEIINTNYNGVDKQLGI